MAEVARRASIAGTIALLGALLAAHEAPAPASERRDVFVFPDTPSRGHVHASTLVELPNGDLLVAWYENGPQHPGFRYTGPDRDKSDDVRIAAARWRHGEAGWGTPFVLADTYGVSDNNPALGVDRRGRLWLFHPTLLGVPERPWSSALLQYHVASAYEGDGALRWDRSGILPVHAPGLTQVVEAEIANLERAASDNPRAAAAAKALRERLADPLSHRLGWMPRTHPLPLDDGRMLLPAANENVDVAAMVTVDEQAWSVSEPVPTVGVLQPALARLPDGRIIAFFRDGTGARRIRRAESHDGGRTWSAAEPTSLPNPGSGVDVAVLPGGEIVLAFNDQARPPRDRLALALSTDGGRTWPVSRLLEHRPGERFDYPSLIVARDGSVHVTYSWNLRQIKHVRVTERWLKQISTNAE